MNRPGNYIIGDGKVGTVEHFLNGFNTACYALGHSYGRQNFETVIARRGWERHGSRAELLSKKTGKNIKDSGVSDAGVTGELFAIEIECWKSLLDTPAPDAQP